MVDKEAKAVLSGECKKELAAAFNLSEMPR